jgi:uncharacterized protein YkwD
MLSAMRVAHLVRIGAVCAVFAFSTALMPAQAFPAGRTGSTSSVDSLRAGVLVTLNQIRVAHGLVPLTLSSALSAAARQHSAEMLTDGYFAHNSADGSVFWKRIQRYYPDQGYQTWSVGENLLWDGGALDANGALALWMASPEHRANILDAQWREIGVAALYEADAPGVFGGNSVTLVATDFGARR